MRRPVRSCTNCDGTLKFSDIPAAGTFSCPLCGMKLRAAGSYARWIGLGNVILCTILFALSGLRGPTLALAVALVHFPIQFVALRCMVQLIPPRIEIAGPARSISQIIRERNQRTQLKLDDKNRS